MHKFGGWIDNCGMTALVRLFESTRVNEVDFNSAAFKLLFNKEKYTTDLNGVTALEIIMKYNPKLVQRRLWFVHEL